MFDVGKAAADDKQCIAGPQRFLGGGRPEQADPARAMGVQVRKGGFPKERLGNRRREPLRDLRQLGARVQRTPTGENANLPAFRQDCGRLPELRV